MPSRETLPVADPVDLEGVEALFEAWVAAVARRDAAEVARLHVPNGVFQPPGSGGAKGRHSIRRCCADWLGRDSCSASFALEETRLFAAADIATCSGRFTLAWPAGSNGDHDHGRLLLVAERDRRRWRLRFSGLFSDAFLSGLAKPVL